MIHGPFPIRVGRLLGGLAFLILAVVVSIAAMPQVLACGPSGGDCRLDRPFQGSYRFSRGAIQLVRVFTVSGNKGRILGQPSLLVSGSDVKLSLVSPEAAKEFARTVEQSLASPQAFQATLPAEGFLFVAVAGLMAMGIGLFVTALRGIGRYRLNHDVLHQALNVERTVLGARRSRSVVSTAGVVDVEVDWARDRDFFHGRGQLGDTVGRLRLLRADGESLPLTPSLHRGYTLHLRAAEELRALLHCPPRTRDAALRQDAAAKLFRPAPPALGGKNRFAAVWLGLCCGSLAGMALYAVAGLALGVLNMRDSVDGLVVTLGAGGGALGGVALALYLTHPRPPR